MLYWKLTALLTVILDSHPLIGLSVSSDVQIYLDDVQCTGNEASLLDCDRSRIGEHDCGMSDGAGVRCNGECEYMDLDSVIMCCCNLSSTV